MVLQEQLRGCSQKTMSMVMWNTFTGSTPYKDILRMSLRPRFLIRFSTAVLKALLAPSSRAGFCVSLHLPPLHPFASDLVRIPG
ncbi:hypothetical protein ACFLU6_06825 [Acidobacteriota bacterium]